MSTHHEATSSTESLIPAFSPLAVFAQLEAQAAEALGAQPAGGPVEEDGVIIALAPPTTGRWLITTAKTRHVLDLNTNEYMRVPSGASQSFACDGEPGRLTRVVLPCVGLPMMVFFDDPRSPYIEQWRVTSSVCSISRLPDEGGLRDVVAT